MGSPYEGFYNYLLKLKAEGDSNIVTEAAWVAEAGGQGGVCGRFAVDETARTFRVPYVPFSYFAGAGNGEYIGQYLTDQMRPITGAFGNVANWDSNNVWGMFAREGSGGANGALMSAARHGMIKLDTSTGGVNYSGARTRPQSIATNFIIRVIKEPVKGLLTVSAVPFNTVRYGYLSLTLDNGVLTKAAFPDAYAELVNLKAQGEANIVTLAAWDTEAAGNADRNCGRFALDEDTETFRLPFMPGSYWAGLGLNGQSAGDFLIDQMRPITGNFGSAYSRSPANFSDLPTGVLYGELTTYPDQMLSSGTGTTVRGLDSSKLGLPFSGNKTRPQSIVMDYQIKMYGTVADAGNVELAALISAMSGKLDTSRYEVEDGSRMWCWARINGNTDGSVAFVSGAYNIISVTKVSVGRYRVLFPNMSVKDENGTSFLFCYSEIFFDLQPASDGSNAIDICLYSDVARKNPVDSWCQYVFVRSKNALPA